MYQSAYIQAYIHVSSPNYDGLTSLWDDGKVINISRNNTSNFEPYSFPEYIPSHHSGQRSFLKTCPVKAQNCLLIILDPVCAQENSLKARVFEDTESRHWLKHSFMSKFISGK